MHLSDVYHGENVQMFWQKKRKKAPNEVPVNSHKKPQKGITDQKKKKEADGGQADLSAQDLKLAAILGIQN